jgi:hypothetical protein
LKKVDDELDLTLEITSILNELSMIAKNLGLGPIILIFDDADALVKHENLIRSLKSIFSELDGYNLIFLGTEASRCKMKIFPRLYAIEIPYFSDTNEIKSCIMEHLTSDEKMIINDKVFEEILNLSQGCPRIVMLIAHYMYKEFLECEDRKEFSELNFYVLNNVRFQLDTQNLDKEIYEKVSAAIEKKLERMKERAKYNDPRFAMSTGVRMNRTNGPLDQIR